MASDDIALLADALSKTHVGDGELSYKGRGLKLDSEESGEILDSRGFNPRPLVLPAAVMLTADDLRLW